MKMKTMKMTQKTLKRVVWVVDLFVNIVFSLMYALLLLKEVNTVVLSAKIVHFLMWRSLSNKQMKTVKSTLVI